MRAYADTLMAALADHAPDVAPELVELNPAPAGNAWGQRAQTLLMPAKAFLQRDRQPDLWHILDGSRAYIASALGPAPIVVTVHDIIPWLQAEGRFPGSPAIGRASLRLWRNNGRQLRAARGLACVSESTSRDVALAFGAKAGNSHVVPLPLRPGMASRVGQPSDMRRDDKLVLHVGNNGFYKNRAGVLRIFARIDPAIAPRLAMAGPAPTEELRRLATTLGLADRIDWVCDPDDDVLANLYRRASVLLFPSVYEGFGWPVLEAMAFGLPVVVANAGSLPEVVGDAAPCLPPDDESGFAAEASRILSTPGLAAVASKRSLDRARIFTVAAFARRMQLVYSSALSGSPGIGA